MTVTSLDRDVVMVSKSPLVSIMTNRGSSGASTTYNIPQNVSGWGNNVPILDAVSCTQFNTASNGALSMAIEGGMPRVLIEASKKGSLCTASTQGDKDSGAARSGAMGLWLGGVLGVMGLAVMVL